jgi:hypothetical protein
LMTSMNPHHHRKWIGNGSVAWDDDIQIQAVFADINWDALVDRRLIAKWSLFFFFEESVIVFISLSCSWKLTILFAGRTPSHGLCVTGAFHLKSPTGGSANGTPRK